MTCNVIIIRVTTPISVPCMLLIVDPSISIPHIIRKFRKRSLIIEEVTRRFLRFCTFWTNCSWVITPFFISIYANFAHAPSNFQAITVMSTTILVVDTSSRLLFISSRTGCKCYFIPLISKTLVWIIHICIYGSILCDTPKSNRAASTRPPIFSCDVRELINRISRVTRVRFTSIVSTILTSNISIITRVTHQIASGFCITISL